MIISPRKFDKNRIKQKRYHIPGRQLIKSVTVESTGLFLQPLFDRHEFRVLGRDGFPIANQLTGDLILPSRHVDLESDKLDKSFVGLGSSQLFDTEENIRARFASMQMD
jgi:hypothetical protein